MGESDIEAQLNYLCRDKYYHAVSNETSSYRQNNIFKYYKGFALLLGGGSSVPESMRILETLESDDNLNIGVILTLIYAHKKSIVIDRDAIKELEQNLKDRRKRASAQAFYYAALFLYHASKYEKARDYVDRSIKLNSDYVPSLSLKGWITLAGNSTDDALHYFQLALDLDKNYLDALLGLVTVDKMLYKYDTAIAILNRLIVKHPQLVVPLIEKMKVQLAQRDWDQVLELSNRILNLDKSNMEAIKLQALCMLNRDGKINETIGLLEMLYAEMELNESNNVPLFTSIAQLFSRICGRNNLILQQTYKFAKKSVELSPNSVQSLTELGYQLMLQDCFVEAMETFQSATKLDESSVDALTYLTLCQLIQNNSLAQQQIELLHEIQGKKTSILSYMSAILVRGDAEKALISLNEAVALHLEHCSHLPYSDNYLKQFDPDFLIQIVNEYMRYFPPQQTSFNVITSIPNEAVKKSSHLLKKIIDNCPALLNAIYLLAKVEFHSGEITLATNTLQHIIKDIDPTLIDAHLLLARIFLHQNLHQRAAQVLEICVSYNFRVRENPLYHLINGLIVKYYGKYDECIEELRIALDSSNDNNMTTLIDRSTLYLELVDALVLASKRAEAEKVIQDAIKVFSDTSEQSRISIVNADFCIKNQEFELAFDLLEQVKPGDPYYLQAHTKLANLYLHKRRDRGAFTKCFREVVENCPGPETFVLLGDAYMSVLELDLAIESYQQALKQNAHDTELAKKMGKALVTTFRYDEAIIYYKEAIKNPNNFALKFDLADLFVKLDQFDEAEKLLADDIMDNSAEDDDNNPLALAAKVKQLMLLGKVRENAGKLNTALSVTKEARDIQHKLQRRAIMDQTGDIGEQKLILSDICVRLAEICKAMRDNDQAIQHYKEALNAAPNQADILISLAKLYLQMNFREQCEEICNSILLNDPEHEGASIIMADLAFRKVDFDIAMHHFKQLLLKQPHNWTALARLIEVARRTGKLDEIPEYLKRVENDTNITVTESGFAYCSALYEWYSNNLNAALRNFNKARMDTEWGQKAIYNMIEICLNPDDDFMNNDNVFNDTADSIDSRVMAIEMAERLHHELKPKQNDDDDALIYRLYKNFILLATKQKSNVERALQDFSAIASQDAYKDHVGPILGMASAYLLLKQNQRARNHLKRVVKAPWSYEDAEYLERCWLLLADNYLQSSKYEIATDLLKRVLQHNRSCVKAYEYSGYIAEKDQNYKEAAYYYERAWKLSGHSKPTVGYKLAYTFLKSRQYADAIEISTQVLKEFPEYPKIKKDILEKARNNLRT